MGAPKVRKMGGVKKGGQRNIGTPSAFVRDMLWRSVGGINLSTRARHRPSNLKEGKMRERARWGRFLLSGLGEKGNTTHCGENDLSRKKDLAGGPVTKKGPSLDRFQPSAV